MSSGLSLQHSVLDLGTQAVSSNCNWTNVHSSVLMQESFLVRNGIVQVVESSDEQYGHQNTNRNILATSQ